MMGPPDKETACPAATPGTTANTASPTPRYQLPQDFNGERRHRELSLVPPGAVPDGHPGLTARVLDAIAAARLSHYRGRPITDEDGPHLHHWQPILWWCRGCGAFEEDS